VPLMEALAIEAQKAGGMVTIFLSSDSVVRSLDVDVPEQFLSQEPRFFAEWLKQVDVFITLPSASNIKALDAGVPATRLGKLNQAGQFLTPLLDDMKFREVDITYPTRERGASWGIEGATYVKMMWAAIGADYQRIAEQGKMEDLQAGRGLRCLNERMAASSRPTNVIGAFSIGLDPAMQVHGGREAAYYGGGNVAGIVSLFIGDNQLLGGNNSTTGNFG